MKITSNSEIRHSLFLCFLIFSFLVLPLFYFLHAQGVFSDFLDLDMNEKGDALAGIFSSLAFLAAVGALLIQRKELREQREATQDMAKAMAAQTSIFEDEQLRRNEARAEELLDQKLKSLITQTTELESLGIYWVFSDREMGEIGKLVWSGNSSDEKAIKSAFTICRIADVRYDDLPVDQAVRELRRSISRFEGELEEQFLDAKRFRLPRRKEPLGDVITAMQNVASMKSSLSDSQKERLDGFKFDEIISHLNQIVHKPAFWNIPK